VILCITRIAFAMVAAASVGVAVREFLRGAGII